MTRTPGDGVRDSAGADSQSPLAVPRRSAPSAENSVADPVIGHDFANIAVAPAGGSVSGAPEGDPELAPRRIKGTKTMQSFPLLDAGGAPVVYDADDARKGYEGMVELPQGTLVAKLSPNPDNPDYVHVIAFHGGKYREGYIDRAAFTDEPMPGSPFDVGAFIDDADHTLHRVGLLLARRSGPDVRHLRAMADLAAADLEAYRRGELKITPRMLEKIGVSDQTALAVDQGDKPSTMKRFASAIFDVTDPAVTGGSRLSETILFVPLTDTWFASNGPLLKSHYDEVVFQSGNLNRLAGTSGEGTEDAGQLAGWFDELFSLQNLIRDLPASQTPEGKWLQGLTPEVQTRTKRLIFIHGEAWKETAAGASQYAGYVATNTTFGPLRANPLMLLMMHEINVNTNDGVSLMGEDSHLPPDDTQAARATADRGEFGKMAGDSERLDDLFQAQSGIALTVLSRYLKLIKAMQKDPD